MGTAPGEGFREEADDLPETEEDEYDPFEPTSEPDVDSAVSWVRRHLLLIIIGTVVVFGAVFGYGYLKRSVPFRIQEDTIVIHGDDIEAATRPSVPEGFPSDVPIFPGAELQTGATLLEGDTPDAEGNIYVWMVPDVFEVVTSWYQERLELSGWEVAVQASATGKVGMTVRKIDEERGFLLSLTERSAGRSEASLVFGTAFPE